MLDVILNKYNFSAKEKDEFVRMIYPIFTNENFQLRMQNDFPHHNDISLGYHILSDAAVTYKLCQMNMLKKAGIDTSIAVITAMMHDLYTMPWQNNPKNTPKHYYNEHGFRHPLEAVINSIYWFPNYFKNEKEAEIIIDGIVHHMFPYPVRRLDETDLELKNNELFYFMKTNLKTILKKSSNCGIYFNHLSLSPSKYIEGKIVSLADKKVAFIDDFLYTIKQDKFKSFHYVTALINGKNKNLNNYKNTKKLKK